MSRTAELAICQTLLGFSAGLRHSTAASWWLFATGSMERARIGAVGGKMPSALTG